MTKKDFIEFEQMCRYGDCTKPGTGIMLGTLYCQEHLQEIDVVYEKLQTKGPLPEAEILNREFEASTKNTEGIIPESRKKKD